MSKKTGESKEARMIPDPNIMPGPMPPPPPIENIVVFEHYIGDYVQVRNIGFVGNITALGVNQTGGNICLLDNGSVEKWYSESMIDYMYYRNPEPPYEPYQASEQDPSEDTTAK